VRQVVKKMSESNASWFPDLTEVTGYFPNNPFPITLMDEWESGGVAGINKQTEMDPTRHHHSLAFQFYK